MPAPWEKYGATAPTEASGPWAKYGTSAPVSGAAAIPGASPEQLAAARAGTPAASEPSFLENVGRQVGLTARGAVGGLASVMDLPAALTRAAATGINSLTGSNFQVDPAPMRRSYENLFDTIGVASPRNRMERVVQAGLAGATSALATAGSAGTLSGMASSPVASGVLRQMAGAPAMQGISGVTGGAAGQTAAEYGAGPIGQTLASLAGGLMPSAPGAAAGLLKQMARGGDANLPAIKSRIDTFNTAGIESPSVGQATGSRISQALESGLSKLPGGAGPMANAAEGQQAAIGARAAKIADELSSVATPAVAGRAIEQGIAGRGGFVERFKEGQQALYNNLDRYIPKQSGVDVSNTKNALATMSADIPDATAISAWFKNSKISGIESAMKADTSSLAQPGGSLMNPTGQTKTTLPYESIKKLRTLVGAELENTSLVSDVPRSKWKNLYAALSQDLESAVAATGNPEAVKAMERANQFTRAGYQRIESVLDSAVAKDVPEQIYRNATNQADMAAGATKIGTIMKSISPAERDVVKSAFIRRMGTAMPGNQSAEGDVFSSQTFLTNWNKMSPQAKTVMFSSENGQLRSALDDIAKASQYIKEGSKVFSNPSGTTQATAMTGGVAGVIGSLAAGQVGTTATILGGMAGANITAKMMTNPKFVNWLATATKKQPGAIPSAVNQLRNSISSQPVDVRRDIEKYLDSVEGQ